MSRIIDPFKQFLDDNGDPLINGLLHFYESGTNNTDKATFADINEIIENANPVVLDGAGRCPNVFGTGSYNVISYTSAAVQIQQFDPVSGDTLEGAFSVWNAITIYGEGDIVTGSDGLYYRSITSVNQNQNPITTPGQWEEIKFVGIWNTNVTYDAGDSVYGSDGVLYLSLINTNLGNNPTTDDASWRSYLFSTSSNIFENVGFTSTIAAKALTFALKTKGLTDPTSLDTVNVAFRSETLTTGDYDIVNAIAATSVIVPSGATLGFTAVETDFIYLYAINNAGEIELAVSASFLDDSLLYSTVAIDATADSGEVLYSTAARLNVPVRMVGRINVTTGAVAGEWDNAPTDLFVGSPKRDLPFLESFKSEEQTITAAGSLTIAHSLSASPSLLQARLICKTAEFGYSIGDDIGIAVGYVSTAATDNYGMTPVIDSTNIDIRFGAAATTFLVHDGTTGLAVALTNANWKLIVRAWV